MPLESSWTQLFNRSAGICAPLMYFFPVSLLTTSAGVKSRLWWVWRYSTQSASVDILYSTDIALPSLNIYTPIMHGMTHYWILSYSVSILRREDTPLSQSIWVSSPQGYSWSTNGIFLCSMQFLCKKFNKILAKSTMVDWVFLSQSIGHESSVKAVEGGKHNVPVYTDQKTTLSENSEHTTRSHSLGEFRWKSTAVLPWPKPKLEHFSWSEQRLDKTAR